MNYITYQARALDFFKDYLNTSYQFINNTDIEYFDREDVLNIWTEQRAYFKGYDNKVSRSEVFSDLFKANKESLEGICEEHCPDTSCELPFHCHLQKEYAIDILKQMDELYIRCY